MKRPSAEHAMAWYVACLLAFIMISLGGTCAFREKYTTRTEVRELRDQLAAGRTWQQDASAQLTAQQAEIEALRARVPPPRPPEFATLRRRGP